MKACGIVVEYNPFHNGHLYHAKKARELSGADVVIAVMSGNWLQRGEPAITDKWSRAEVALNYGVDLVFELPLAWSMQSADYFAQGAVAILQAAGCGSLCFGTDSGDLFDYQKFGQFVNDNQRLIDQTYQNSEEAGKSYPERMRAVLEELYPDLKLKGSLPNHILGLAYAQENAKYQKPMTLLPIKREVAGYHEASLADKQIASATGIREGVRAGEDVARFLPAESLSAIEQMGTSWEAFWPYLRYQIISSAPEQLTGIYQMVEGLEHRMQSCAKEATSFNDFVGRVKSKRYTWTRIQRLCGYVLLQITEAEIKQQWQQNYLHLLGFTPTGNQYLKQQKKAFSLPLYAKFGRDQGLSFHTSFRGDEVYRLGNSQVLEQNYGRIPLMK